MNDDRIDFGPLDPQADPERLERIVSAVLARAAARKPPAWRVASIQIARWRLPALAVAASVTLVSGVLFALRPAEPQPRAPVVEPAVARIVEWAWTGQGDPLDIALAIRSVAP